MGRLDPMTPPSAEPKKCPDCGSDDKSEHLPMTDEGSIFDTDCTHKWHDAAHSTPAAPQVFQGEFTPDLEWKPMASHSTPAAPAETYNKWEYAICSKHGEFRAENIRCPKCAVAAPPSQHEQASTEKWQYPHPLRDVSMCDQHIVEWGSREGCHICALTAKVRADESAREKYEQLAPSPHDERAEFEKWLGEETCEVHFDNSAEKNARASLERRK